MFIFIYLVTVAHIRVGSSEVASFHSAPMRLLSAPQTLLDWYGSCMGDQPPVNDPPEWSFEPPSEDQDNQGSIRTLLGIAAACRWAANSPGIIFAKLEAPESFFPCDPGTALIRHGNIKVKGPSAASKYLDPKSM